MEEDAGLLPGWAFSASHDTWGRLVLWGGLSPCTMEGGAVTLLSTTRCPSPSHPSQNNQKHLLTCSCK